VAWNCSTLRTWWRAGQCVLALIALFAVLVAPGCATQSQNNATQFSGPYQGQIERIPFHTFDLRSISPHSVPQVDVRLAQPAEVGKVWPESSLHGFAVGTALAAAGVAVGAGPGAVVFVPFFAAEGALIAKERREIVTALGEVDLPARLKESIRWRLARNYREDTENTDTDVRVEVLILTYGLGNPLDASGEPFCFNFDSMVTVRASDQEVYGERILIGSYKRSEDVPPPRCGSLEGLGKAKGQLTREILTEASELLAAVVVRRLGIRR